ncbi:type II toxin-antitoxin system mRNA interferase toxin, RelE/StbE family [Campylobacter coli]|uniref:type II toxin-antitoxin system YafQ family toxin n=1 Tax=Campylobacter coli TaxID=195 RepID=UPI001285B206|nr:type II toxin-antitoxin system YafQ family toxin [Campylobacter coli]EAI7060433.1 type II toxin-antitoxin system YafQ family toxin [Campylobacter coli]EAL5983426.1 type II toxin-antitoxin system YafQ family toxin [Campylobacter coli]EDO7862907.1 type II toxin-antitoxin system mRNA interferase toxin, RelE/StbE family [Campylobacter coli]EIA3700175.1 type II toxin-antitoxin system YafQ family toxin [Campylobacter coli]MED7841718.1 type II toxin-antitoxin system YafQ family toxin [Campylobacte
MRKINLLRSFKKDYEKVKKQSWDLNIIDDVIQCLMNLDVLPTRLKDHALKGEFKDFRECHIKSNLLLIYQKHNNELELNILKLGSHSKLFKKY